MKRVLPAIVISQFFCTSLWFAGNAIIGDIVKQLYVGPGYLGQLASSVQAGFITGTLVFAILSLADRFSPSRVFFISSVLAALVNLGVSLNGINAGELLLLRFATGFFLAGIYPVGMKIAADHYREGLGKSLGFLVGALVLGTSFPHLLKSISVALPWQYVIYTTSLLAVLGGLAILALVPDGPYRRQAPQMNLSSFSKAFRSPSFRAAAFGYFGHMWELYAFWVFVPAILTSYNFHYPSAALNVPLLSFFIIAAGSIACVVSGLVSQRLGVKKTATVALSTSGICCVVSPLLLYSHCIIALIIFLFVWSTSVIADSPLFSTLVAKNAPDDSRGAALTIVNCIGFSITILSIQLISALRNEQNEQWIYMLLGIGPVLGLIAMLKNKATV